MSKLVNLFAALVLIAGAFAVTLDTASAQRHHGGPRIGGGGWHGGGGGWHGRGWRGGGWGWGPGFVLGLGLGAGYPYYGGGPYYGGDCGWVRVRVWRLGRWYLRRAWRCW